MWRSGKGKNEDPEDEIFTPRRLKLDSRVFLGSSEGTGKRQRGLAKTGTQVPGSMSITWRTTSCPPRVRPYGAA